jgi:hypothetical protein
MNGSPSFSAALGGSPSTRQGPMFVGQRETGFAVQGNHQSPSFAIGAGHGPLSAGMNGSGSAGMGGLGVPGPRPVAGVASRREVQGAVQSEAREQSTQMPIPYHTAVLPTRASPKDTGGFDEDAFRPLWNDGERTGWEGFQDRR